MLELVAGAAFTEAMRASSAPKVLLFRRFRSHWESIDQRHFQDASTDEVTQAGVADVREDVLSFVTTAMQDEQPRADYREVLELTAIFLGSSPSRGTHFRTPGAMHQARWMSKIIYTFKVWMFRSQFSLTAHEERGLRDLCVFFSRVYVRAASFRSVALYSAGSGG